MSNSFPTRGNEPQMNVRRQELIVGGEVFCDDSVTFNRATFIANTIVKQPVVVAYADTSANTITSSLQAELGLVSTSTDQYTISNTGSDHIIGVNTSDSSFTTAVEITLPDASVNLNDGRILYIVDTGGNASNIPIIITTTSSQVISGNNGVKLSQNYNAISLFSVNSNWFVY